MTQLRSRARAACSASLLAAALLGMRITAGTLVVGPWSPMFKGVDFAAGTNTPNAAYPDLMVMHVARLDLTDPDLHFITTPRITSPPFIPRVQETSGMTVERFLEVHGLQLAINANFFSTDATFGGSPNYYLPEGTPFVVEGQMISEGVATSTQRAGDSSAALIFDQNNRPTFIATNWPPASTNGIHTAVTGLYPLVLNGVNIGREYINIPGDVHQTVNPRTAFGLSRDDRYLYLLTIDGRQKGYSDGALDYETGGWLVAVGVYNGINMDGGGSTTLVKADSDGSPVRLNFSNAAAPNNSGQLRTVGAHFGVYAKPVPGFFNDVVSTPDDTAAGIAWTTAQPATAQVQYGLSTNFDQATTATTGFATNHTVLLTNLTPGRQYFYQLNGDDAGGAAHVSPVYSLATTNHASTTHVFDLTQAWKFSYDNLDGVPWTTPGYDDSSWNPGGAALLWIDVRATPDANVQPKTTQLPADPSTGYPYITYYFRTHFTLSHPTPDETLGVNAWIDDGAVFYLNGMQGYSLRMNPSPGNADTAAGYPCAGDAVVTCVDNFTLPVSAAVDGDNVLAVEVHNYNPHSPDITFGMTLDAASPVAIAPALNVLMTNGAPLINWSRNGFLLQSAPAPDGPWSDLPGPVIQSPFSPAPAAGNQFFRLAR
jgi:Phosphodiester glycosidase/Purple acid Phosphatase, N-terminal domain